MRTAPIEKILVETDSPVEYQGKISEPADLTITLRELARIKDRDIEEVRRITTSNAKRLFGI
jgi:TatD DNase family protein